MTTFAHALQLVAVATLTALALSALGAAPARLLLGRRAVWPAATPALGFAGYAVIASWLSLWLPMRVAVWPIIALAALSLAVTIAGPLPRLRRLPPAPDGAGRQTWLLLALLSGVALLLALSPALFRPDLFAIGPNWDLEIYLPLAAALTDFPNGFSFEHSAGLPFPGLPNPLLWRINHFDPRSAGLAFSLLHASTGAVFGLSAHQTYIPTLAALAALAVPGGWLLLATALPRRWALAATAALTVNAAAAFVIFMGFGQQVAAAVLLAPLVAIVVSGLRAGDRAALMAAALLLAGLLATYGPALPLAAVLLTGAGLGAAAVEQSPCPLVRLVLLTVGAAAVVPFAVVRLAVRAWYAVAEGGIAGLTAGPGVEQFAPLAWGLGLLPSPGVAQGWDMPTIMPWAHPAASIMLMLVVVAVSTLGMVQLWKARALPVLGALAGCGALLLALRFIVPYPYGYFKLLPSAASLLLVLPAAGFCALVSAHRRVWPVPCAFAGLVAATGLTAAVAASQSSPHAYAPATALERIVAPGDRVCVTGGHGLEGPPAGAAAYVLRHADLYGEFKTGYSTFFRPEPAGVAADVCDWFLLPAGVPPLPGRAAPGPVWQALGWDLYQRQLGLAASAYQRELVEPPRIDRDAGTGVRAGFPITQWRSNGAPDIESWTPPLLGVLAPTWGAEWRWRGEERDERLLHVALTDPVVGRQASFALRGTAGSAEAVLDIYRADGTAHYGYWQLGPGPLPGRITLDLTGQRLVRADGTEPPHETFPVPDGRYRGYLARYRQGRAELLLPIFSFRLLGGIASEFVMERRGDLLW